MPTTDLWQVREYDATRDAGLLEAWAKARGVSVQPEILSPVAVVVEKDGEPMAFAWLFLCVGVAVGIVDKCLIKPELPLSVAREAARHCVDCLKQIGAEHGLRVLYTFTPPGIGRELKHNGWDEAFTGLSALTFTL